jgi:hypothetical protein
MSTDNRVTSARDLLAGISPYDPADRVPSVLVRECGELRRALRQVLDVVADDEAAERDEEQTQVLSYGGLLIAAPDVDTVLAALSTATLCCEVHDPDEVSQAWAARFGQFRQRLEASR